MYKITIKLPIDFNKDNLKIYVAKEVRLKVPDISKCKLLKLSLDARDKNKIFYLASICFETFKNLNLKKFKGVSKFKKKEINFPCLSCLRRVSRVFLHSQYSILTRVSI